MFIENNGIGLLEIDSLTSDFLHREVSRSYSAMILREAKRIQKKQRAEREALYKQRALQNSQKQR